LRYDLNKGVFEGLNEEGLLINIREIAIVTKVKELAEFMQWLEDENSNEHLYTKEGERVYRIYENTKLIRTLKDLASEMGIYEKKNL
jgi:exoribonuclease R